MPVQSVQVGMILDRPPSSPQITQYVARQPWPQIRGGFTDSDQVVNFKRAVQRIIDGRRLVEFSLAWSWPRFWWLKNHAGCCRQGHSTSDRRMEGRDLFGRRVALRHRGLVRHGNTASMAPAVLPWKTRFIRPVDRGSVRRRVLPCSRCPPRCKPGGRCDPARRQRQRCL